MTPRPMVGRDAEMARLRAAFDERGAGPAAAHADHRGRRGRGQVAADAGVPGVDRRRGIRRPGALPALRPGHHVLAARRDRPAAARHRGGRPARAGDGARSRGLVGDHGRDGPHRCGDGPERDARSRCRRCSGHVQRLVEILAERGPVVLVIDDIHWAEPTLLDLIEHLGRRRTSVCPALVLCTARHELLDERTDLGRGRRARSASCWGRWATTRRVPSWRRCWAVGRHAVHPRHVSPRPRRATRCSWSSWSRCSSMTAPSGSSDGDWRLADDAPEIAIPPTIHALLAARLDRLGRDERAIIEPASVIGLVFQESAVSWLAPDAAPRRAVPGHLATLDRRQLVHPTGTEAEGEAQLPLPPHPHPGRGLRQPPQARSRPASTSGSWSGPTPGTRRSDRGLEFQEILGYHLEQAHRYLAELGPLDAHGIELGVRASERLAAAGRRAYARGDMPATANLLRRAGMAGRRATRCGRRCWSRPVRR